VRAAGARAPVATKPPAWAIALGLVLLPALRFDYLLWTDPPHAPLPEVERLQFVNGWPSGYGVRETIAFLRGQAHRNIGGVQVVLQSDARRTMAFASASAFHYDGWVVVSGIRLADPAAAATLATVAREMPTFLVIPEQRGSRPRPTLDDLPPALLLLETRKPDGSLCNQVYALCREPGCGS
jgi:hypothetical protein